MRGIPLSQTRAKDWIPNHLVARGSPSVSFGEARGVQTQLLRSILFLFLPFFLWPSIFLSVLIFLDFHAHFYDPRMSPFF